MFCLVVVLACVAAAIAASRSLDEKIIGGNPASLGQFPYQVSLRTNKGHICGGTIIGTRFIITAAHCIQNQSNFIGTADDYYVVIGSISSTSGGTIYTLEKLVAHAEHDREIKKNDIAILKTYQDIAFSSTVGALPLQKDEVPTGSNLTLSGWGMTCYPSNVAETLQYITLQSIDNDRCARDIYPTPIFDSTICTLVEKEQGSCLGDSGGPLVYKGHLAGVASWVMHCASGDPDGFMKVSSYISWIQHTIQSM